MQEPEQWEKENILFYLQYVLLRDYPFLKFEKQHDFDFSYDYPRVSVFATSHKSIQLTTLDLGHGAKIEFDLVTLKDSMVNNFHYEFIAKNHKSFELMLQNARTLICKLLNDHCSPKEMLPWEIVPLSDTNKQIHFRISQQPAPKEETEEAKQQRKELLIDAGCIVWNSLTGNPVKKNVQKFEGCLVGGTLAHERIEGKGLCLVLKEPNLEKLHHTLITPPPTPKKEEQKQVRFSNNLTRVSYFAKSPKATSPAPPPSAPLKKPARPSAVTTLTIIPPAPPKAAITKTMSPPPARQLAKLPPTRTPVPEIVNFVSRPPKPPATSTKRSYAASSSSTSANFSTTIDEVDKMLRQHKEKKARELERQNRGEDEKSPVLFLHNQRPSKK